MRKNMEKTFYTADDFPDYPQYEIFTVNVGSSIKRERIDTRFFKE